MTYVADTADAATLERAADILIARSRKPRSFWLGVLVKVLRESASRIRAGERP